MERCEADGLALNIGSGESVTICAVAEILATAMGVQTPLAITGQYRAGDIRIALLISPWRAACSATVRSIAWRKRWESWWSGCVAVAVDRVEEARRALVSFGLTA